MDEGKDKDVSVSRGNLEEPIVTVSEHVAGESETRVESMACEVQGLVGQVEGSTEEGGSGGGEDIMVEAVGSDIFVDGVCGDDSDAKVGRKENLNGGEICDHDQSGEAGLGRDLRSSGGGDDVVGDLGARGIVVSGSEPSSNDGFQMGVGGPVVEESVERNREVIEGEAEGDVVDEIPLREVEVSNDEVPSTGIGTAVEGGTAILGSMGGETQVVRMDDAVVVAGEENLERGVIGDNVERGSEMVGSADGEAQGNGAENGIGSSTVVSGALDRETQVLVVKEIVMENKNSFQKELDKNAEQGCELNGGRDDANQDVETQKLGVLDDEIWNPGIETAVSGSPAIVEDSSVQTQVAEEAAVLVNEEADSQAKEGITSSSEEKQISMAETNDGGTGKDAIVTAGPKSLDEQIPVAVRAEVAATDQGEYMCSTIEGMETDTFDENLSFSLEELQENMETADESTENHCNVCADSTYSCQPTQVFEGEDMAMAKKVHPDFEEAQQLKLEGYLDQRTAHVGSNTELATDIDEQVSNAQLDGMLSCSGNVQNHKDETLCTGTGLDTQVTGREDEIFLMDNQGALNSNVEVQGPAEKDQQVKLEERIVKSGACHLAQVDSNIGKGMSAEQQVNETKPVSSEGGQEIMVQKHLVTDEMVGGSEENNRNACFSTIPTGQPTYEVVGDESIEVDDKFPSNLSIEVPGSTDLDGTLSCSGNDESLDAEVVCGSTEMDIQAMDGGEIAVKDSEEVLDSNTEGLGPAEGDKCVVGDLSQVDSTVGQEMQVEEQFIDAEQVPLHGGEEMEVEELDTDTEQPKTTEEKFVRRTTAKAGNLVKSHQASYQLPLEDEDKFDVFDLVWGKVRSHPWWPGQIYDPSDASEKAMKYHKKDCFLVAYFGDRTFAWVDASQLKPFYSHFSQVEKQSNSEVFQNAVNCALEEVSRRVELELACSCIPKDIYDDIRLQIVENAGIQQELSMSDGVEKFASVQSFQPDKLVEYMKALAQSPSGGADRLELVIAKAQLLSFYRLKGYHQLPEFQFCGGLVETGADAFDFEDKVHATPFSKDEHIYSGQEISGTQRSSYHKRKHNLKDSVYPRKKERSLSELMSGSMDSLDDDEFGSDGKTTSKLVSPSSGKKRKVVDSTGDDSLQDARKTISLAKVSIATSQVPKPSFKIGECIRRVASQMTGSPSILKSNSERFQKYDGDGVDISFENLEDVEGKKTILPADYSSLDDLLSQLHLAARDPMKGYSFLSTVISFFSDFRNSIVISRHSVDKAGGKRKKPSQSIIGSPETFEFEDMSDTYWTDRVIQNGAEEQPSGKNSRGGYQIVPVELGKPVQKSRRSSSRKQYSDSNHDMTPPKPPGYVDENSPAELIMNFPEVDCIPSETNLNKMFRRFGPLKESETEVDEETSRARVVFKKCSDAEVAYNSAAKFNIFGSMVVNYQLSYTVSVPFKTPPIVTTLGEEYAT